MRTVRIHIAMGPTQILTSSSLQQALSISSIMCSFFLYGFSAAWSGPALALLTSPRSPIPLQENQVTLISSTHSFSNMLLSLICLVTLSNCSRKMLLCCILFSSAAGWGLRWFATSIPLLILSQVMTGVATGLHDIIAYIYLGEVLSPKNRGPFGAICLIIYSIGNEIVYVIGSYNNYALLSAVPFAIALLSLLTLWFSVESPYYLMMKDKREEAFKVLLYLNKDKAKQYYDEIMVYCEEEHCSGLDFLKYIIKPQNCKLCVAVVVINALVYVSSLSAFTSYGTLIVRPFGISSPVFTNIFGISSLVFIIVSIVTVKLIGRRPLLLYGFVALALIHVCWGALFIVAEESNYEAQYLVQIVIFMVFLTLLTYQLTVYPAIHILRSEIFPYALKERGSCLLSIFKALAEFTVTATFFGIASMAGTGANFFIYSICSTLGAVYVFSFLKETRNKTLEEIRNDYAETM